MPHSIDSLANDLSAQQNISPEKRFLTSLAQWLLARPQDDISAVLSVQVNSYQGLLNLRGLEFVEETLMPKLEKRLAECIRKSDLCVSIGKGLYLILLSGLGSEDQAEIVAERLLRVGRIPVVIDGISFQNGFVIGVMPVADGITDAASLVRNAKAARYRLLRDGIDGFDLFLDDSLENYYEAADLEFDRSSLGIEMSFQHQVAEDGLTVGVEVLPFIRNIRGQLLDYRLFRLWVDDAGLVTLLEEAVVDRLLHQIVEWKSRKIPVPTLSLWISAASLMSKSFIDRVCRLINDLNIAENTLVFDFIESTLLTEIAAIGKILGRLTEAGVRIAVKSSNFNFLTGAGLEMLPIKTMKINCAASSLALEHSSKVIQLIAFRARKIGLSLSATNVNSLNLMHALKSVGCESYQGTAISAAISLGQLEHFVV